MVILLTGATGFLGQHILDKLSQYEVRVITRDRSKFDTTEIDVVEADISNSIDPEIFQDVDCFIHSAAKVGNWPKDPMEGYYQTNVEGTQKLLEIAIEEDVDRIIYTSSYFALGATRDKIGDEYWNNPPNFDHPYVNTKYEAGQIVDSFANQHNILQLLPTTVIGPGIDNQISDLTLDYINGKLPGVPGGDKYMNFVDVEDVAEAHYMGVTSDMAGKYLIGGENLQLKDYLKIIGDKLNIKPPRSLPYWLAKTYAWFLELFGDPKLTRDDIEVSKRNYRFSISKAQDIGYEPTSISNTIDKMMQYFLDENKLNEKGEKRVLNYFDMESK